MPLLLCCTHSPTFRPAFSSSPACLIVILAEQVRWERPDCCSELPLGCQKSSLKLFTPASPWTFQPSRVEGLLAWLKVCPAAAGQIDMDRQQRRVPASTAVALRASSSRPSSTVLLLVSGCRKRVATTFQVSEWSKCGCLGFCLSLWCYRLQCKGLEPGCGGSTR